jgi:hypothetical protein
MQARKLSVGGTHDKKKQLRESNLRFVPLAKSGLVRARFYPGMRGGVRNDPASGVMIVLYSQADAMIKNQKARN